MREIKMTEITQIEIESIWKCEYCGRPLPAPVDRVDVIDVRSHRILTSIVKHISVCKLI